MEWLSSIPTDKYKYVDRTKAKKTRQAVGIRVRDTILAMYTGALCASVAGT